MLKTLLSATCLSMSLLSLLFGCKSEKTPIKTAEYPRFPATDNPAVRVDSIPLDAGYLAKSFFIPADKLAVYVLGVARIPSTTMEDGEETRPDLRDRAHYRLYCLDVQGKITHRLNLPPNDLYMGGVFGVVNDQLMLWFGEEFLVLDPEKCTIREKIPVYGTEGFPSKQDIELMTPDEQQDAYLQKFDAVVAKPAAGKWLEWPFGGGYMVFVDGPTGKRSAWAPINWDNEVLADLRSRFAPQVMPVNPNANNYENGDNFHCSDGPVQIREADYISAGSQLDYPNYKNRMVLQYEMVVGDKTLHFSTTDRSRHKLRLDFSDNRMLATADGAGWIKYEGVLYRVE